jgi:hypothetical protein
MDNFDTKHEYRNFTNQDLEDLIDLNNHKAIPTGLKNWEWKRFEKGSWVIVPNIEKKSARAIYSYITFSIANWKSELEARMSEGKKSSFFKQSKIDLDLFNISMLQIKTKEKVREILSLYPDMKGSIISEALSVDIKTIYKHIKNIRLDEEKLRHESQKESQDDYDDFDDWGIDQQDSWLNGDGSF